MDPFGSNTESKIIVTVIFKTSGREYLKPLMHRLILVL